MSTERIQFPSGAVAGLGRSDVMTSVLTSVSDICILLAPNREIISSTTRPESTFTDIASAWAGLMFDDTVDPASAKKLSERIVQLQEMAAEGIQTPSRWAEFLHKPEDGQEIPVRYALHYLKDSQQILMLGQDQRPVIEMQQQLLNAQIALERDYEAQREVDTRYRILMDYTSDAIVIVSTDRGRILDINHNAATLLDSTRAELVNTPFAECFTGQRSAGMIAAFLSQEPTRSSEPVIAELRDSGRNLKLFGKLFRASGEQITMVRLTDPALGSVSDGRLVANLRHLFQKSVDAIVFTDRDGNILSASETFLNLTDAPSAESVRGRSVSDFMGRGAVDLRILLENARRAGHLRMYATKIKTDFGAQVPVEISATWLEDQLNPVLALVIRNAANASALRVEAGGQDTNMQNVIELVGSSTLKDIVSETTEVIEKICIETAIELTRNNRVAAAEMLGLSRQSLYVKLRKYDLLSREET